MRIPPHDNSASGGCIGAFALPCKTYLRADVPEREGLFVVTSAAQSPATSPAESSTPSTAAARPSPAETPEQPIVSRNVPLRILMVEDQAVVAKSFILRLQDSDLTKHYVIHHAPPMLPEPCPVLGTVCHQGQAKPAATARPHLMMLCCLTTRCL